MLLTIAISSLILADKSYALSVDKVCGDVSVVYVRGSGGKLGEENERIRFERQLKERLTSKVSLTFYELGSESYGGAKYPAVDVKNVLNGNAVGAFISNGSSNDYGKSVALGRTELEAYIKQRTTKCPNERIVLGGYSQGAQVIGESSSRLQAYANKIDFIALFGDPKLYLPEGEGIYPVACKGINLSEYRRDIGDCHADNGSLGARKPTYVVESFKSKTGLWCAAKDYICGTSKLPYDQSGHSTYAKDGSAIDKAAKEIAAKLKKTVSTDKATTINASHTQNGVGTTGLDMVFVIDTTGSMGWKIEQAKAFARKQAATIKEKNGRVALVAYRDAGDEYTAKIISGLQSDQTEFLAGLDALTIGGGGDTEEAALHALMTAFNGLTWEDGATKAAVLLTDAPFHQPDKVDGSTIASVAKRSLEIDPVNVYPVVPEGLESSFVELAEKTTGQVIKDVGNTEVALTQAVTKIQNRPTAVLKNPEYSGLPGDTIQFDASESYIVDAAITKYEWDFNGDGVFDRETSEPVTSFTYPDKFDGTMQVRISASNNTIANASAFVKIGTYVAPVSPKKPTNVTVKVMSTKDGVSTVKLEWKPGDSTAQKFAVASNGVPLGYVVGAQTSIEIRDVLRNDAVDFSVSGINSEGRIGDSANVVLSPLESVPSKTPSWWQMVINFLTKIIHSFTVPLIKW
jgi:Mg-chelatase subunit ChlD